MPRPERVLDPSAGVVPGFASDLRELRTRAGSPGYRELAGRTGYSATTLSEAAGGRRLPMLPVVVAFVRACGGDVAEWEQRWRAAAAQLAALRSNAEAAEGEPPYRGLASFRLEDADRYFGRERLVAELMERLATSRFLAVFGASGSGKSSLLRAGLLPAAATAGWRPVVFTPGTRPETLPADGGLVIVDQFEEIFTLCRDEEQRRGFVEALLGTAGASRVVLGVRADFYAGCARFPALVEALRDATVLIGPMSEDELIRAVTRPAILAGLTVERALVTRVLADAAGQPGALPLASHALLETWRQRQGTTLTVAGYHAAGGMTGAIAATAERVFRAFDADQQATARQVLLRLTALGEGTEDTRRRVRRAELDLPGATAVIDELVAARLVVVSGDAVEIAHEALIGAWPRLRGWLTDDREALRVHRQLTEATASWEMLGRDSGVLYRGVRLALAREWSGQDGRRAALTPAERGFIEASEAAEENERAAAGRRARQMRALTAALAALLVLAVGAGGVAARQWRNAVEQRQQALSRQLAAQALGLAPTDVAQAVRYSLDGYRATSTVEARGALLSLAGRRAYSGKLPHASMVNDVAFSPDGTVLAAAAQDGQIIIWEVARRAVRTRIAGYSDGGTAVAFSPDGRLLATGGRDGKVLVWDVASGVIVARAGQHAGKRVDDVAFSPDGTVLASIGQDKRVLLWGVAERVVAGELAGHGGPRAMVAFSPDGRRLASAGDDGTTVLWDLASRTRVATLGTGGPALHAVAFSPDGQFVAVAGVDRDITVWDATAGRPAIILRGHNGRVVSMAYSRDGSRLYSAGFDPYPIVWDMSDPAGADRPRLVTRLMGHTSELFGVAISRDGGVVASAGRDRSVLLWVGEDMPVAAHTNEITSLAAGPDGRTVVSGSLDDTAAVWAVDRRTAAPAVLRHSGDVAGIAISPDGRLIATASADRRVRIWDAASHRLVHELVGHGDRALSVSFHPDGTLLATAGAVDHTVRLWDPGSGRQVALLDHPQQVEDAVFSSDGTLLASVSQDGRLIVWDTATRTKLAEYQGESGVLDMAASRGTLVAIGLASGNVSLWDLTRGPVATLHGHSSPVRSVAFSPDGSFLAAASHDATVMVWDVAAGELWAELVGHVGGVAAVAWAPEGRVLYSGGDDHTITGWVMDPADAHAVLCARLGEQFPLAQAVPGCAG